MKVIKWILGGGVSQAVMAAALALKQDLANLSQDLIADQASTTKYPSVKAVWDWVSLLITGVLKFQTNIDCSTNPNYPAATKGWLYYASVAGKIGGASGVDVEIGDAIVCKADNAGGTQAAVGSSWFILEHNLQGALLAANNLSDLTDPAFACSSLGRVMRYGGAVTSGLVLGVSKGHHFYISTTSAFGSPVVLDPTIPSYLWGADDQLLITDLSQNSLTVPKVITAGGGALFKDGINTPSSTFSFDENYSRTVRFVFNGTDFIVSRA